MSPIGLTIFIRFPGETQRRILCPSTVTQTSGANCFTVQPENHGLAFAVGQEMLIYFEQRQQFVQQPAVVEALLDSDTGQFVVLKTMGEPVSAESRQCYRISTVLSNLKITFDGVEGCSLRDVSVTGFAVVSPKQYKTGQVLDVELLFEDKRYIGQASIQSMTQIPDGMTRYGVNCVKGPASPTSLSKGVQQVSMSIQRQQLNRLAGGA